MYQQGDMDLLGPEILGKTVGEVLESLKMPAHSVVLNSGKLEDGTPYTIFIAKGPLGKAYEAVLGPALKATKREHV